MGKSIRSNSKKSFRSQRRAKIEDESVYRNSEASRAAAMAKCLASAPKPGILPVPKGEQMEVDGSECGGEPERGRTRSRSAAGRSAAAATPSPAGSDVDMDDADRPRSVRGPNQYKKQGRLKRGAKALLGTKRGPKKVVTVKQHGLAKAKRKPRFSKTSKKR